MMMGMGVRELLSQLSDADRRILPPYHFGFWIDLCFRHSRSFARVLDLDLSLVLALLDWSGAVLMLLVAGGDFGLVRPEKKLANS